MRIDNRIPYDKGTQLLAEYIAKKGVALKQISAQTGISYGKIIRSLSEKTRPMKTDEFLSICYFLEIDPMRFYVPPNKAS